MSPNKNSKQIGDYNIIEEIGAGGMGKVLKAAHKDNNKVVAIKILKPSVVSNRESYKRFVREMQLTAQLKHSNIITLYDVGVYEKNKPYFIMDFVEGITLKQWIKKKRNFTQITQVFMQILDAVGYAHNKEIIHRDLKPANVMITSSEKPVIMDFGLAKSSSSTTLTASGQVMGSIYYMSPEQANGERKQVD